MSSYFYNAIAFLSGFIMGGLYFGSLFLQLKKLINLNSSFIVIIGFFGRFLVIGLCLFLLIKFAMLLQILLFFIGFITALIVMILRVKKKKKNYEN